MEERQTREESTVSLEARAGLMARARRFLDRHHKKLWWLHSAYAMALGACVVVFAEKGLVYVRWLLLFLLAAWFIIVALFRIAGSGKAQRFESRKARLRFLLMTYVLKNLYQGMLFFLLPFYWKAATFDAANAGFVVLLAACTILATLDLVFDRVLMRWRLLASAYYGMALFACLNLAVPTLLPIPAVWSLALAAMGATIGFWTLHFDLRLLRRPRWAGLFVFSVLSAWGVSYIVRRAVPPVPMTVVNAAVGPDVLINGRLGMTLTSLHESLMNQLVAETEVQTLADSGEDFVHVWRHFGDEVLRLTPERVVVGHDRVRLRSTLRKEQLPRYRPGPWTVDVETDHGQLVGRFAFAVRD